MSETKHTPGPWEAVEPVAIDWRDPYVRTADGESTIALTYGGGPVTPIESPAQRANARLIAAAPDLLEALQRMIALDPPLTGNPSHSALVKFWQYEREQGNGAAETQLFALAAIAAATGATP